MDKHKGCDNVVFDLILIVFMKSLKRVKKMPRVTTILLIFTLLIPTLSMGKTKYYPPEISNINSHFHQMTDVVRNCNELTLPTHTNMGVVRCKKKVTDDTGIIISKMEVNWLRKGVHKKKQIIEDHVFESGIKIFLKNEELSYASIHLAEHKTGPQTQSFRWIVNDVNPRLIFTPDGKILKATSEVMKNRFGFEYDNNKVTKVFQDMPASEFLSVNDYITSIYVRKRPFGPIIDTFVWSDVTSTKEAIRQFISNQEPDSYFDFLGFNEKGNWRIKHRIAKVIAEPDYKVLRKGSQLPSCKTEKASACWDAIRLPSSYYFGETLAGRPHGFGTEFMSNGDYYSGEFASGRIVGVGTYVFFDGGIFSGSFSQYSAGRPQKRFGSHQYTNGDEYVGPFLDNVPHGLGTYYHADSRVWTGTFGKGAKTQNGYVFANTDDFQDEETKLAQQIQSHLKKNKYLSGAVDGVLGPKTENAFYEFDKDWSGDSEPVKLNHYVLKKAALLKLKNANLKITERSCAEVSTQQFGFCLKAN